MRDEETDRSKIAGHARSEESEDPDRRAEIIRGESEARRRRLDESASGAITDDPPEEGVN